MQPYSPDLPTDSAMPPHVLVVEDDVDILENVVDILGHHFEVTAVDSGEAACEQVLRADFDAVVCDLRLAGQMDGLEVIRRVKDEHPDVQVVVVTAYATRDTAVQCLRAGASDFLAKPFAADQLLATVRRAVEHRSLSSSHRLRLACQAIFATTDLVRLPDVIVETATTVLRADDATLLLPADPRHLFVAHSSARQGVTIGEKVSIEDHVAGRVLAQRRGIVLHGDATTTFDTVRRTSSARSSIVYPLFAGERVAGVLAINRRKAERRFRAVDLENAAVVAAHALLALENARLTREVAMASRLAAIGQIANAVIHEINNPLAAIVAGTGQLRLLIAGSGSDSALAHEILDDLEIACALMQTTTADVRCFATDEGPSERVDLGALAHAAMRIARVEVQRRGASVRVEARQPAGVRGNRGRLSQVLVNLVVNVAQAGASMITVRTDADLAGGRAIAEVADNGGGIVPEDHGRVFEPYFSTKREPEWAGFELWIAREIVEDHGGHLSVRSHPGAGTTYRIELPLAV